MAIITITQVSCDAPGCTTSWSGPDYNTGLRAGWGYDLDHPDEDLCPQHAVDPDDRGACAW